MSAVDAAQRALVRLLNDGIGEGVVQDRSQEIRYTRAADFTDAVAREYLDRQ